MLGVATSNVIDAELNLNPIKWQKWTIYPPSVNPCCERSLGTTCLWQKRDGWNEETQNKWKEEATAGGVGGEKQTNTGLVLHPPAPLEVTYQLLTEQTRVWQLAGGRTNYRSKPNRQAKCWECLLLQTADTLKRYISLEAFLVSCCGNAVLVARLGLGTKDTWLGVRKRSCFGLKHLVFTTDEAVKC